MEKITNRKLKKWSRDAVTFYILPIYSGFVSLSSVLIGIHLNNVIFKVAGIASVFLIAGMVFTRHKRTKIEFETTPEPEEVQGFSLVRLIGYIFVVSLTVLTSLLGFAGFLCILYGVVLRADAPVLAGIILILTPIIFVQLIDFLFKKMFPGTIDAIDVVYKPHTNESVR